MLQFHNGCDYIKSWVERERGYQAQKGNIQKRSGPKRPRNPKVFIPLENGKSTENASIKYTLNHWKDMKKSIYMPLFKYLYGINTKTLKSESLNSFYLWHCSLGHISDKRVSKLHKLGDLRSFDYESYDTSNVVWETKDLISPFK